MKIVAIIQARMKSTRLPGKVLCDICGETMLSRVVHRAERASLLNDVVIATSIEPVDDAIVNECRQLDVSVFRGNENDVLDRYYRTASSCGAEVIVRITADCPLVDPTVIDKVIHDFLGSNVDYASNTIVRTYPRGLDVEVMRSSVLTDAWCKATKPHHRAHVTPYIYENPNLFTLLTVTNSSDYSYYRWTVDTPEDLEFVRQVYRQCKQNSLFSWQDIVDLCERNPALTEVNKNIEQKSLEKG